MLPHPLSAAAAWRQDAATTKKIPLKELERGPSKARPPRIKTPGPRSGKPCSSAHRGGSTEGPGPRQFPRPIRWRAGLNYCHRAGLLRVGVRHLTLRRNDDGSVVGARIGGVLHQTNLKAVGSIYASPELRGRRGRWAKRGKQLPLAGPTFHRRGARGGKPRAACGSDVKNITIDGKIDRRGGARGLRARGV